MSEKLYLIQEFVPWEASSIYEKSEDLKSEGYRLVQICATMVEAGFELLYSFDKDHVLFNLKVTLPVDEEIMSISRVFGSAFIFENEIQDLFGVKFKHMTLNYGGKFFKVSIPTPWNPGNKAEEPVSEGEKGKEE